MTSKFQNQLVVTIILITLCGVTLPSLLDCKKYYQDEFAAILLVSNLGNSDDLDAASSFSYPETLTLSEIAPQYPR